MLGQLGFLNRQERLFPSSSIAAKSGHYLIPEMSDLNF
jgi:hypothetical protein